MEYIIWRLFNGKKKRADPDRCADHGRHRPRILVHLFYGMWFIAAVVAYLVIRKPGVALIAEFAAASGETIVMLQFDVMLIVYGLIQGL